MPYDNYELTAEQQKIADEMFDDLAPITFIQGKAGTGKSYLIKALRRTLDIDAILCPTNLAKQIMQRQFIPSSLVSLTISMKVIKILTNMNMLKAPIFSIRSAVQK